MGKSDKDKFKEYVEKKLRENNIEPDTVDYNALYDSSLSLEENIKELEDFLGMKLDYDKEEIKQGLKKVDDYLIKQAKKEEEKTKREFNKQLEKITKDSISEVEKIFEIPLSLVEMTVKGINSGLLLESEGGMGKSRNTLAHLSKMGLKKGVDFAYLNCYYTPLEFYKELYENKDKKVIVLDDLEGIFSNKNSKAILKSALDNSIGFRQISYKSTSSKLVIPKEFEIKASIICLANEYPDDKNFRAVMDRCIYYKLDFSHEKILEIMTELIKKPYKDLTLEQRKEVLKYLREHSSEATNQFSLRTLFKAMDIYRFGKNWKLLVDEMLEENYAQRIILDLDKTNKSVKEQQKEFTDKTGLSRRSYFRYKRRMGLSRNWG